MYLFLLLKSAVLFGVFLLSACNEKQETIKTENFQHKRSEQIRLQEITKQQLTRGVYADLVIDPLLLAKEEQTEILRDIFEGLTGYNAQGKVIPAVAEHWQTEDNKNWIFVLREDAKWSNGVTVKAQDFVNSWRKLALSDNPLKIYLRLMNISNAEFVLNKILPIDKLGVFASNERLLHIQLDKPTPQLPAMLTHAVLLPKYQSTDNEFITNGAYQIAERQEKQIALAKNPYYRESENVYFDRVIYREISQNQSVNSLDLVLNAKSSQENLIYLPQLCVYFYEFNFSHPHLKKSAVRRALISMATIPQTFFSAKMQAIHSFLPHSLRLGQEDIWEPTIVEKLFAESQITEKLPLKFTLTYDKTEIQENIARKFIQHWSQSDLIHVRANPVSREELLQQRAIGDFDVIRSGWCADYKEPSSFLLNFHSKSPDNKTGYQNIQVDQLLEKALQSVEEKERNAFYMEIIKILQQDQVVLPIFQPFIPIWQNNILGIEQNNDTGVIYSKDLYRNVETGE
ncbi:peptide ABC transporter substrate-binding protein [Histophilus somni]|uniref:Peptide ABC transporter substrate-binding protein n=1 Tax=Histophilus somni TaxID=731 RepID=A0AAX2RZV4_HISSO|nr:peptide ABC transporter substrate-binding protein [Histophilus somni]TEW27023.1 peptide ABC transporter substrate-binding protein [Histophilus somni]TFF00744.1 peptide ABC transporter substrate-binding protein [Histophilus somni]THA89045.1 peptide ABC transporter substrate-binding protein [Histophilus somni]TJY47856.1 peptide ABC transporter substrate-binding protein [Histophilus somni]